MGTGHEFTNTSDTFDEMPLYNKVKVFSAYSKSLRVTLMPEPSTLRISCNSGVVPRCEASGPEVCPMCY